MATLTTLPEEILLNIVKIAARRGDVAGGWSCCDLYKNNYGSRPCKFDHDFLVDVVSKISVKFEEISRDETFWEDDGSVFKLLCISNNKHRRGPTFASLPDEIVLKILKLAAGSLVQQSTRGFFSSSLGYVPSWMNSPGVPKWFRSKFMGHCCYKYRAPMGYYASIGSACEYQHDFIAEVVSKISSREVFQSMCDLQVTFKDVSI